MELDGAKFNLVKQCDSRLISTTVYSRYRYRNSDLTIVELGCNRGEHIHFITRRFPGATVFGIDPDEEAIKYAKANCDGSSRIDLRTQLTSNLQLSKLQMSSRVQLDSSLQDNPRLHFVNAFIDSESFLAQTELKPNSVDIVIAVHCLNLEHKNFERILENIHKLLKKGGVLYATFSLWSDLFEIGYDVAEQMFKGSSIMNSFLKNKPNHSEDIALLKRILSRHHQFGSSPEIVKTFCQIQIHSLKQIQDTVRAIFPFSASIPDIRKLEYFYEFFERIYNEYFTARERSFALEYEYLQCCLTKI